MHYIMVRFVLKEQVYDDLYMFAAMIIMTLIGILYLLLYGDGIGMIMLRYAVTILTVAIFAIAKRRDIITLINYVKKRFLGKNQWKHLSLYLPEAVQREYREKMSALCVGNHS